MRRHRPFGAEANGDGTSLTPVAPPVESGASRLKAVSRRSLFGLALATVVAGCSSKSSTDNSADGAQGSSTTAGVGANGSAIPIGGAHVSASQQVSTSDAQRFATQSNGHWQGGWHDSTGAAGGSDIVVSFDTKRRTVRARVAFDGDLLGSPVPAETYEIDLLSFMLSADSYDVSTPQLGKLNIVPGGATSASATARSVPGHADISKVDINGSRIAQRVDVKNTITYVDGHTVKGTMAWTRSGAPAKPAALPTAGAPPNPVDVQSGTYAAGLLTGSDLTTIFGSPFPAPSPNGGRLLYANGIDTSDASADADDYHVAYTVYVGDSAAATSAFWAQQGSAGQAAIPGSWKTAFWLSETNTLYVYATDNRVLTVDVTATNGNAAPTAAELSTWQQFAAAIATKVVAALSPA